MRCAGVAVLVAIAVAVAASASAAPPPPLLGIKGDPGRFQTLTGQDSQVRHVIVGWGQGVSWGSHFVALFQQLGGIPMIGLATGARDGTEAITPQQIAQGTGDAYLIALGNAISEFGQEIIIRPFGEMNGYWNKACAYTKSGTSSVTTSTTSAARRSRPRPTPSTSTRRTRASRSPSPNGA